MMEKFQTELAKIDWAFLGRFAVDALTAIGVLILGFMIARWVERLVRNRLGNNVGLRANDTVRPLLATVARYAVIFAAVYAALTIIHVPAASLLAVFGAAGLAIALAVQGTLSNVAAGLMLIFLRSVRVGDYIQTGSVEGTVLEIGLFVTHMKNPGGVFVAVPNSQVWSSQIHNYSKFKTRRVDINIDVGRDNDLARVQNIIRETMLANSAIIAADTADVVVQGFTATAVTVQARCWFKADNFRSDTSSLRTELHEALRKAKINLPKPVIAAP